MPHSSQQDNRSSVEISTEILALLWMHILSDIASAAPKACGKSTQVYWFENIIVGSKIFTLLNSYPAGATRALVSDLF